MNHRINPYQHGRLKPLRPSAPRGEAPAAPAEAQPAASGRHPVSESAAARAENLSPGEQQMIARYFPASDAMTLRLYGAHRGAQTLNPRAVGGRLDVSG